MMQSYKGVRDFYPEDQRIQQYLFATMRAVVERFGYEEINASVLEPTELYLKKTSEEIITDESYTFEDRGGRSVTLRPEMTPTVARMVASRKRELGYPLRWYSIPNVFRYEKPQRGRLREHWQLNVDLFGVAGQDADAEVITVAYEILRAFGAKDEDFEIRISDRRFLDALYDSLDITSDVRQAVTRLLDKKEKRDIVADLSELVGDKEKARAIYEGLDNPALFPPLVSFVEGLNERGVTNARIDTGITRGFDYYTGIVFEVFDTNPKNPRAIFGGGRYDNLIEQYGKETVSAFGFGMGDVTTRDFLETHTLLPQLPSSTTLYVAPATEENNTGAQSLADTLRAHHINVAVGIKPLKIADHIKNAEKLAIPFFVVWGDTEQSSGILSVKNLETGEVIEGTSEDIIATLSKKQ